MYVCMYIQIYKLILNYDFLSHFYLLKKHQTRKISKERYEQLLLLFFNTLTQIKYNKKQISKFLCLNTNVDNVHKIVVSFSPLNSD